MPKSLEQAQSILKDLGFLSNAFDAVSEENRQTFLLALAKRLKKLSDSGLHGIAQNLIKSIFFFAVGDEFILYQFVCDELESTSLKITYAFLDTPKPEFRKHVPGTLDIGCNQLALRSMGRVENNKEVRTQLHKWILEQGLLDFDLHVSDCNHPQCTSTNDVEQLLLLHFEDILNLVKAKGHWDLPDCVLDRVPRQKRFIQGAAKQFTHDEKQQTRELFERSPHLLKKFCHFKILEIANFDDDFEDELRCDQDVYISVIEQQGDIYYLSEAKLEFMEDIEVVGVSQIKMLQETHILGVLAKSKWLTHDDKAPQVIRLANQGLDESLAVQYCMNSASYGVLSKSVGLAKSQKTMNFWLDLAQNLPQRQAKDETQIHLIAEELKSLPQQIASVPKLSEEFNVELKDHPISQKQVAEEVLYNQRANLGTLIHYPTGYGKTYILLMAMSQHFHDLAAGKRRPYLIIAPKLNIREHWLNTLTPELRARLFPEAPNVYSEADESKSNDQIIQNIRTSNACIVILTDARLRLIVNSFFAASPGLNAKASFEEFIDSLDDSKYKTIKLLKDRLRNVSPPIFNKDKHLVMGTSEDWAYTINKERRRLERDRRSEFNEETFSNLLDELAILQSEQFARIQLYEAFKRLFNGIVLDESHELLSVRSSKENKTSKKRKGKKEKKSSGIKVTQIILDFANTFQCAGRVGAVDNRLILASSATPWPNNMEELKLHMRLVFAKTMGEFSALNEALFRHWDRFESVFDEITQQEEDITQAQLNSALGRIRNSFIRWVRLLFHYGVRYQPPLESRNLSTERIVFSNVQHDTNITPDPDVSQNFNLLREFYSAVLGLNTASDHRTHHAVSGQLYKDIRAHIGSMDRQPTKIAFFVELTKDAAALARQCVNSASGFHHCFVSLFYGSTIEGLSDLKALVPQNIGRDSNRNAFNNIVKLGDLTEYAHKTFHPKAVKSSNGRKPKLKWKPVLKLMLLLVEGALKAALTNWMNQEVTESQKVAIKNHALFQIFNPDQELPESQFSESMQKSIKKLLEIYRNPETRRNAIAKSKKLQVLFTVFDELDKIKKRILKVQKSNYVPQNIKQILKKYLQLQFKPQDNSVQLGDSEQRLITFLETAMRLIRKSQYEIIENFEDELASLLEYLPFKNGTILDRFAALYHMMCRNKLLASDPKQWQHDEVKVLQYTVMAYFYKVACTRVLIFGDAGVSSMAVDAQVLVLLSSAWTKDKLTQVEGRVGRIRGGSGQQQHCEILLPITDAAFEYKVLSYHLRKDFYNLLIISHEGLTPRDIVEPMMYAAHLTQHYTRLLSSKKVTTPFVHRKIRSVITEGEEVYDERYLGKSPTRKADVILPKRYRERLQQALNIAEQLSDKPFVFPEDFQTYRPVLSPSDWDEGDMSVSDKEDKKDKEETDPKPVARPPKSKRLEQKKPQAKRTRIGEPLLKRAPSIRVPRDPHARPCSEPIQEDLLPSLAYSDFSFSDNHNLIVIVPTRGEHPDIPFETFLNYVEAAVENLDVSVILIFAINAKASEQHRQNIRNLLSGIEPRASQKVYPIVTTFVWSAENYIPYGFIRNVCFVKAKSYWQQVEALRPNTTSFISLDGDVILTEGALEYFLESEPKSKSLVMTAGYEMVSDLSEQGLLDNLPDQDEAESHWQKYWVALAARIHNDTLAKLKIFYGTQALYFGYMAEPMHAVSVLLAKRLFAAAESPDVAANCPYGNDDREGRQLVAQLRRGQAEDTKLITVGPSTKAQQRVLHTNNTRFKVGIPTRVIKSTLTRAVLAEVILSLRNHPQHIFNHSVMASNIAAFKQISAGEVKEYTSYYYLKPMVLLLALGPKRCMEFANILVQTFRAKSKAIDDVFDPNLWSVSLADFKEFVIDKFITRFKDKANFKEFALLTAVWAREAARSLMHWFTGHYEGEYEDGRYVSITLPPDYPVRALQMQEDDDRKLQVSQPLLASSMEECIAAVQGGLLNRLTSRVPDKWFIISLQSECGDCVKSIAYTQANQVLVLVALPEGQDKDTVISTLNHIKNTLARSLPISEAQIIMLTLIPSSKTYKLVFFYPNQENMWILQKELSEAQVGHNEFTASNLQQSLSSMPSLLFRQNSSDRKRPASGSIRHGDSAHIVSKKPRTVSDGSVETANTKVQNFSEKKGPK